jgi:hypothetical protein
MQVDEAHTTSNQQALHFSNTIVFDPVVYVPQVAGIVEISIRISIHILLNDCVGAKGPPEGKLSYFFRKYSCMAHRWPEKPFQ